jgi:hypothetical protein
MVEGIIVWVVIIWIVRAVVLGTTGRDILTEWRRDTW